MMITMMIMMTMMMISSSSARSAFHSKAKARECLLTSLKDLKLDYVDLYLIHWPMGFKVGRGRVSECFSDKVGVLVSVLVS